MTGKRPRDICPTCGADVALFQSKGYPRPGPVRWGQHNRKGRGQSQCPRSGEPWTEQ